MDDTVLGVFHSKMGKTKLVSITCKCLYLMTRHRFLDGFILILCGDIVVGHAVDSVGAKAFDATASEVIKSLWRCYFMTVESVNIELRGTIFDFVHNVRVPYFIKKCVHFY
jgi:hypothetical protein